MNKKYTFWLLLLGSIHLVGSEAVSDAAAASHMVWDYVTGHASDHDHDHDLDVVVASLPEIDVDMLNKQAQDQGYATFYHLAVQYVPARMSVHGSWHGRRARDIVVAQECSPVVFGLMQSYVAAQLKGNNAYDPGEDGLLSELLSAASSKGNVAAIAALKRVGADFAWRSATGDQLSLDDREEEVEQRVVEGVAVQQHEQTEGVLAMLWKSLGL